MVTKMTIIIHGGSLVGKTALIKAAAEIYGNKKSETATNGGGTGGTTTTAQQKNVSNMTVELGGKKYELRIVQFYDTGLTHEEQQEVMNADGFIVVYDITNKFSVERAKMYFKKITQMKQYQSQQLGTPSSSWTPPLPLILVGNKSDVPETERKVPTTDGWKLKDANQCAAFFETSALKKRGVENVFNEIIKIVSEKKKAMMAEEDEEAEKKGNPLNKLFKSVPESTGGSDLEMQRELRARRLKMQAASGSSSQVASPK